MFYSVKKLSFEDLCTILRYRATNRSDTATPTIYFDASWMARKLSTPLSSPTPCILAIVEQFALCGMQHALDPRAIFVINSKGDIYSGW